MEKYEMSSLDFRFLVRDLKNSLVNGYFRKIYQYDATIPGEKEKRTHQFLFEIFVPGKEKLWLYADRNKMFITAYRKPSPSEPPSFCQLLRKHMENTKILDIRQHEFDRIVEISTEHNVLIIELFSDGNIILCDKERKIIMPLYSQQWKDRDLKPRIPYVYPPHRINPFAVSFEYFREYLSDFDKKIVAVLAAGLGLGPVYAKEMLLRSHIDEAIPAQRLSANLCVQLFNIIRDTDNLSVEPTLYAGFVSPFPLQNADVGGIKKQGGDFSAALDEFFSEQQIRLAEDFDERLKTGHRDKFGRMLMEQESSLQKWSEKKEEKKSKADLIYSNYASIDGMLGAIKRAKASGMEWEEIKAMVKEIPDGNLVKEIREGEAKIIFALQGSEIEIDFRKSVMENAKDYYERSKFAKRKIEGVHEAMHKTRKRMEEEPQIEKVAKLAKAEKKEKKWFEKFRWFTSSGDFLVVGGKDATSNEVLIKKYTEKNDAVFHSEIQGSPFVVIKTGGKYVPETAKKEAAEFAAAYSKAWQSGLGAIDVYCIRPEQVSKQAQAGEYLPKGSFMIYGEREWFRGTELKVAIGIKTEKGKPPAIIAGPVASVSRQTDALIIVKPGSKEAASLARTIRNTLLIKAAPEDREAIGRIPLDDFQKSIPGGKGEIMD